MIFEKNINILPDFLKMIAQNIAYMQLTLYLCNIKIKQQQLRTGGNGQQRQKIMTQTTINIEGLATLAKMMQNVNIEVSNPEIHTYTIRYYYAGCSNFFTKEIYCEDQKEARSEAIEFVNTNNASVAGNSKAGNYIELCFIENEKAETIDAIQF